MDCCKRPSGRIAALLMLMLVLAITVNAGCSDDESTTDSTLSRDQALAMVLEQVLAPIGADESSVVVYATTSPLATGTKVRPVLDVNGGQPTAYAITAPTWLFWVDLEPFARFVHPTKFVYVDSSTGVLRVEDHTWYPVVDDAQFLPVEDPSDPRWVYGKPVHPDAEATTEPRRGDRDPRPGPQLGVELPTRLPSGGGLKPIDHAPDGICEGYVAVVVNGFHQNSDNRKDYDLMSADLTARGYAVTGVQGTTVEEVQLGGVVVVETSPAEVLAKVTETLAGFAGPREVPLCQFLFYYTGHGIDGVLVFGASSNSEFVFGPLEVSVAIANVDACEKAIILDACQAGAFANRACENRDNAGGQCQPWTTMAAARADELSWTRLGVGGLRGGGRFTYELLEQFKDQFPAGAPIGFAHAASPHAVAATGDVAAGSLYVPPFGVLRYEQNPQTRYCAPGPGCACRCCPPVQTSYCDPDESETTGVASLSEHLSGSTDLLCAAVIREVDPNDTLHSSASVPPKPGAGDHTETFAFVGTTTYLDQAQVDAAFNNSFYPCGSGPSGFTLCPSAGGESLPPGDYVVVVNALHAAVPLADPESHYQYGFVFDADGVAANNYAASAEYPNDFFQDTDRWYDAGYTPAAGWSLRVTDASDPGLPLAPTAARVIIEDTVIALVVPASEFAVPAPTYRVTAFRHGGDYGIAPPYDWNGDVEPPVSAGLATIVPN